MLAAIYDIHANLPALEAVLNEIEQVGVDTIVVGGDVVPGPLPRETIDRLSRINIPTHFIRGNGELAVLEQMSGKDPSNVPETFRPIIRWNAEQCTAQRELLSTWPKTLQISVPGLAHVLFCHATPRDENEIFTRLTSDDKLLPVFESLDVQLVVCGHTHMQLDRIVGSTRIVNAGSVGMPFGEPGADWLLLGPDVRLMHTNYDLQQAADRIRQSTYPDLENFIANYLLHPPSEEQMLNAFTRAELS